MNECVHAGPAVQSMRRFCTLAVAAALAIPAQACAQLPAVSDRAPQPVKTCTLLGCRLALVSPSALIIMQLPAGRIPKFEVALDIDGERSSCRFPTERGRMIPPEWPACGTRAQIVVKEANDAMVEVRLRVLGTPRRFAVTLLEAGRPLEHQTFFPQYGLVCPNGPECGGCCTFWKTTWVIGTPG